MGLGKFIKHIFIPGSFTVDMAKNIVEEGGSVTDGFSRTIKEEVSENNPFTKILYNMGKSDGVIDGVKDGYVQASREYENKLLKQADEFIKQKRAFEKERDAYEDLLDEYEKVISQLTEKPNRTQDEDVLLRELLLKEKNLKSLMA